MSKPIAFVDMCPHGSGVRTFWYERNKKELGTLVPYRICMPEDLELKLNGKGNVFIDDQDRDEVSLKKLFILLLSKGYEIKIVLRHEHPFHELLSGDPEALEHYINGFYHQPAFIWWVDQGFK